MCFHNSKYAHSCTDKKIYACMPITDIITITPYAYMLTDIKIQHHMHIYFVAYMDVYSLDLDDRVYHSRGVTVAGA